MDTGAYADNGPRVTATGGGRGAGPLPLGGGRVRGHCVYTQHAPVRARTGRSEPRTCSGSASRRSTRSPGAPASTRWRSAAATCCPAARPCGPAAAPLDADLVGDVEQAAAALGWGEPRGPWVGRGLSVGLLAAGAASRSPRATVRLEADGEVDRLRRHHRARAGRAHRDVADRRRGARAADASGSGCPGRGHALHPVRPLHRAPAAPPRSPGSPCSGPPSSDLLASAARSGTAIPPGGRRAGRLARRTTTSRR